MAKTKKSKRLSTKSKIRRSKLVNRASILGGAATGTAVGGWPIGTIIGTGVGSFAGRGLSQRKYKFTDKEVKAYRKKKDKQKQERYQNMRRHLALRT